MKRVLFLTAAVVVTQLSVACDVCKKQQPKVLENITHGTGPQSGWDYVIVLGVVVLVLLTLAWSLKSLIRPKEKSLQHIKNSIFNHER